MRKTITLLVLLLAAFYTQAQTEGTRLHGIIKNTGGKAVEAVSVSLLASGNAKIVKISITDSTGAFEFLNIKAGTYSVQATAVGFTPTASDSFIVAAGTADLLVETKPLVSSGDKQLAGVTVTARKPLVETKIDRTIVNVEAMISNAGSNALEILEKSPGVMVDKDGNISLKGKQGVVILLDGRPTYLSGQDLANLLKNMPGSELDQFEIMTQPPAKYDASGNAGLINIKTKKSKANGFNGSVTLSYVQGAYPKSPNSLALNWRHNKINVFANYSLSYWKGFNDISIYRNLRDEDNILTNIFDQKTYGTFKSLNHTLKTGLDYTLNKNATIGVVLNGTYNTRDFDSDGKNNMLNGQGALESVNYAISHNHDLFKNMGVNLNFRQGLKKKGSEITADADYVWYNTATNQDIVNKTLQPDGSLKYPELFLRGDLPSDIKIYSFKSDYVLPLKGEAKFEAGIKTSFVKTDNDARYTTFDPTTNSWPIDNSRSTHFLYDENINAGYVNYSRQLNKKWGLQAGLRLENTNGKGRQVKENTSFTRHYTQLFPTLYISRQLNEANSLVLNYGRRIERPNYQDMNPFIYFLDSFTYRQGNPYLMPQYTHNIELTHSFKGALNTTLNYTYTKDIMNDILRRPENSKITFQTKENIGKRTNIGLAISYNAPITKWYTISFYTNGFYNHYKGEVNGLPLDASMFSYMVNLNNQFRFGKTWGAEMSGFYRSTTQDAGIIISRPMGVINFAFSKQILKGKGSLRLAVNDPFWIQKFRGYTKFGNIDADIKSKWDNRRVGLTFVYRFGKQMQNMQPRRRNGGASEEQQRANSGSGQQ